jgi:hypothetical protein
MTRVKMVLLYLNLISLTKLFSPEKGIKTHRIILHMTNCMQYYKIYFEKSNTIPEARKAKEAFRKLHGIREKHKLYEILMIDNIVPFANNMEQKPPVDIIYRNRQCKHSLPGRLYHLYKQLYPFLDFYYMLIPRSPLALFLYIEGHRKKFISGYCLYNYLRSYVIQDRLQFKDNGSIICCPLKLQCITQVEMCLEVELYTKAFSMVYKLSDYYQKLCSKIFSKDKHEEKQMTMSDLHNGSKLMKPHIPDECWNNPKIKYRITPAVLDLFAGVDIYVPNP